VAGRGTWTRNSLLRWKKNVWTWTWPSECPAWGNSSIYLTPNCNAVLQSTLQDLMLIVAWLSGL
jgi:hypothetical protein